MRTGSLYPMEFLWVWWVFVGGVVGYAIGKAKFSCPECASDVRRAARICPQCRSSLVTEEG